MSTRYSDLFLAQAEANSHAVASENRASPEDPRLSLAEVADMLGGNIGPTTSGARVDESSALTFSAVFCAIRIIAEAIAMLPFRVVKEDDGGRTPQATHPAHRLLGMRPNPYMTAPVFIETLVGHAVSWGNCYARIAWDNAGRPAQLLPVPRFQAENATFRPGKEAKPHC